MTQTYPDGTHFESWILVKEKDRHSIRRHVTFPDGAEKYERFPIKKYRHLVGGPLKELENFVIRLNGIDPAEKRARAANEFRHAFISEQLLTDYFQNYLLVQIPTRKDAGTMYRYLREHVLKFFIFKLKLANPLDWHRHQHIWARALLNKEDGTFDEGLRIFALGDIRSAKVLRQTVNEANRFMRYLHLRRPDEVPILKFEPFTRAALKEHEGRRKLSEDVHESKYIPPADWERIKDALEARGVQWRFPVYLAYYYGLRRNEAMGMLVRDIRKAYLSCERQLERYDEVGRPVFRPLKNRQPRKVPHWFLTPAQANEYISGMEGLRIHPDTLSRGFMDLVAELKLPTYLFHDLRRSFITNAVRKGIVAEDLRLAVGHSTIQTTYKFYVMDSRRLDDDVWTPGDVA